VSIGQNQRVSLRSLKVLFQYLKGDGSVYGRFKPNKLIIRKMNIAKVINSTKEAESDLALDFSSFLLRYHRDIDYSDFSDDPKTLHKIKRAETFRSWADIEDLANGFESISTNFEQHQTTAAKAFQELYNYIEKSKRETMRELETTKNQILIFKDEYESLTGTKNPSKEFALDTLGGIREEMGMLIEQNVKQME